MGTVILFGMEPGVIAVSVFKGQKTVLDIVFAESDRIAIDLDLIEIYFLFADVLLLLSKIAIAQKLILDVQGVCIVGDIELFIYRFEVFFFSLGDFDLFFDVDLPLRFFW